MRAFIAIEIPQAWQDGMAATQARLKSAGVDAGWSRPEGSHLTLKFLGETSEGRVPQIMQALTLALSDTAGFRLGIAGVGTFPNPAAARVVWFGITGEVGRLVALQSVVDQTLAGLGLARDTRAYTPHLTLGRIRRIRQRASWLAGLDEVSDVKLPGFTVTAINLIRSELKPTGAIYHPLGKVALQEAQGFKARVSFCQVRSAPPPRSSSWCRASRCIRPRRA